MVKARGHRKVGSWLWALLAVVLTTMTQCDHSCTPSIFPLYTDKDLVVDDTILGVWKEWKSADDTFTVDKIKGHYIILTWTQSRWPWGSSTYEVHLLRLGQYMFVDAATSPWSKAETAEEKLKSSDVPQPFLPLHLFGRISVDPKVTVVRLVDYPELLKLQREKKLQVDLLHTEGSWLITSPTDKLQQFAIEHAEDKSIFSQQMAFCRQGLDCDLEAPLRLTAIEPENADALWNLAIAYAERGRFDETRTTWKRTRTLALPEDFTLVNRLGTEFIEAGHLEDGISVLKAAAERAPNAPDAWHAWLLLGHGYLAADQPQHALAAYQKCAEVLGSKYPFPDHLGSAYLSLGDFEHAHLEFQEAERMGIAWSRKSRIVGIEFSTFYDGVTYFAEGNYEAAERKFEKFIGTRPGVPIPDSTKGMRMSFYFLLPWQYFNLRHLARSDSASKVLEQLDQQAVEVDVSLPQKPNRALSDYLHGRINESQFLAAITPSKGRIKVNQLCFAYFAIGEQSLLAGERAKAREYFQKAAATPTTELARFVAKARLKELSAEAKNVQQDGPEKHANAQVEHAP